MAASTGETVLVTATIADSATLAGLDWNSQPLIDPVAEILNQINTTQLAKAGSNPWSAAVRGRDPKAMVVLVRDVHGNMRDGLLVRLVEAGEVNGNDWDAKEEPGRGRDVYDTTRTADKGVAVLRLPGDVGEQTWGVEVFQPNAPVQRVKLEETDLTNLFLEVIVAPIEENPPQDAGLADALIGQSASSPVTLTLTDDGGALVTAKTGGGAILDEDGDPITTTLADGTVRDRNGQVIEGASIEDGVLVDKDGEPLGSVYLNDVLVKPPVTMEET